MAKRRAIGQAVAGFGASFAPMVQSYLQEQRDMRQNAALLARQQEIQKGQQQQQLLLEALKSPQTALRIKQAGLGGPSIDALQPTDLDAAAPLYGGIDKANTLGELPSMQGLLSGYKQGGGQVVPPKIGEGDQGVRPDILSLLAARKEKESTMQSLLPTTAVESYNPETATTQKEYVRNDQLAGRNVQTAPTPQQAGANELATALAGKMSPEMGAAEAAKANQIDVATRGNKVRTAGAIAGAQEHAQEGARLDPKFIAARVDEAKQKAIAEAAAAGSKEGAAAAQASGQAAMQGVMALSQLKSLYDKVSLGAGAGDTVMRAGRNIGGRVGLLSTVNPEAQVLDSLGQGYSMMIYKTFGGTAANVSDKDIEFLRALVPNSTTPKEVGNALFQDLGLMLTLAPTVNSRHPEIPPGLGRVVLAQKWLKLSKEALQGNPAATRFIDPDTGELVPITKIQ